MVLLLERPSGQYPGFNDWRFSGSLLGCNFLSCRERAERTVLVFCSRYCWLSAWHVPFYQATSLFMVGNYSLVLHLPGTFDGGTHWWCHLCRCVEQPKNGMDAPGGSG